MNLRRSLSVLALSAVALVVSAAVAPHVSAQAPTALAGASDEAPLAPYVAGLRTFQSELNRFQTGLQTGVGGHTETLVPLARSMRPAVAEARRLTPPSCLAKGHEFVAEALTAFDQFISRIEEAYTRVQSRLREPENNLNFRGYFLSLALFEQGRVAFAQASC